jgi:septal ring factor EnvC (AmiA/AmiB activator)
MRTVALALALCFPLQVVAEQDPASLARDAMVQLEEATGRLERAETSRDRVRALTETIQALEAGLGALRSGMRQAEVQQDQLGAELQARDAEIAVLLVALQTIGGEPSPVLFLHPAGPVGSVRAGMILSDATPVLTERALDLRRDLEDLQALSALQVVALERLQTGLQTLQTARSALNQAIAERTELPTRFSNDPVREAVLLASSDTLAEFAQGLDRVTVARRTSVPLRIEGEKGALPWPVQGDIVLRAGEADAAGVARPGIIVKTAPAALVTSPTNATIRYTGPLLDLGQVVILEPQAKVLFILAGLDRVYGTAGEVIDAGSPLGLMGTDTTKTAEVLSTDGDGTGAGLTEALYIEVRENNLPEDPSLWFRTDKDG